MTDRQSRTGTGEAESLLRSLLRRWVADFLRVWRPLGWCAGNPVCDKTGMPVVGVASAWDGQVMPGWLEVLPSPFAVVWAAAVPQDSVEEQADAALDERDRAAIAATLRGDGQAYGAIIERYQQAIGTQMWKYTRDPGLHEELVHDVFVEAFRGLARFRSEAPLLHWLRKIATRRGYRHWKLTSRRRAQAALSLEDWHQLKADGVESVAATRAADLLHALLELLPPRDRLVLTLLYWEQCSVAEASELSGWSQAMVRVQAYRARRKLRRLLEEDGK